MNPWIYSSGYKGFTDITAGQSDGCNGLNTQTGSAVNGVSHATTLWSFSATNFGTVWCNPGCALERYNWVGSGDWIWYAKLRCSKGGCVQMHTRARPASRSALQLARIPVLPTGFSPWVSHPGCVALSVSPRAFRLLNVDFPDIGLLRIKYTPQPVRIRPAESILLCFPLK